MSYIKKVLVLSQVIDGFSLVGKRVSGIARIETIEGVSTFYLSTVNFATVNSGGYFAYILTDNKKVFSFDLGLKPSSITKTLDASINIDKGFAVGISFIKDDVPVLVAFAKGESFNVNISDFKKIVIEKIIS